MNCRANNLDKFCILDQLWHIFTVHGTSGKCICKTCIFANYDLTKTDWGRLYQPYHYSFWFMSNRNEYTWSMDMGKDENPMKLFLAQFVEVFILSSQHYQLCGVCKFWCSCNIALPSVQPGHGDNRHTSLAIFWRRNTIVVRVIQIVYYVYIYIYL